MENIWTCLEVTMHFIPKLYLKISLFLATIAALSAYPIYQSFKAKKPCLAVFKAPTQEQIKDTLKEITNADSTVAATLKEQLIEENNQLLARIPAAFPEIHPMQWQNAMKSVQKLKDNDDLLCENPVIPESDDEIITLIYTTLAEYGINPARVEIEFVTTPQSFLSACQGLANGKIRHIMRVNREAVNKKTQEVVIAYLRHEIQHLLTYDAIELMIVKDVFTKNDISPEQYFATDAFIELKKFKEYRADLLAATKNLDTAQAFMQDMEERIKQFPQEQVNPSHSTHPTETQRKQALANLAQYMQQETVTA